MRRLLSWMLRHEEINGDDRCPTYLHRWTLLRAGSIAIYLHKFVGDDWSWDMHDHPKRFISVGLRGSYCEWTPCPLRGDWAETGCASAAHLGSAPEHMRIWNAPWVRTFPAEHVHRIVGPTPGSPCWTLAIVGLTVREWGFWHKGTWTPWRKYVGSARADQAKSC